MDFKYFLYLELSFIKINFIYNKYVLVEVKFRYNCYVMEIGLKFFVNLINSL